jgi:UPF0755 protein
MTVSSRKFTRRKSSFRFLFLIILLLSLGALLIYQTFWAPNYSGDSKDKVVVIPHGANLGTIAKILDDAGVIESKPLFILAGNVLGWSNKLKAGRYLLSTLNEGHSILTVRVTIPEGLTSHQIAQLCAHELEIDSSKFMQMVNDRSFADKLGIQAPSLEGYLMPNTYSFYWSPDEKEVIQTMVGEFEHFYTDSLRERAADLRYNTGEILSIASLVEGEARIDSERAIIAGVYYNRLKKGMKLEADPTIQYIVKGGPRQLWYKDLKLDSPYNTYLYEGLPPTPINNPGKKSILAALYPAKHSYLYFVANGYGRHFFSKTYTEHQRAVRKYRAIRKPH